MSLTNSYCYRPPKWVGTAWKKYSYRIYKLCLQKCGTKDDADDLFQEVALRFCQSARLLNDEVSLFPWLQTVFFHCCCNRFRNKNNVRLIPFSELREPVADYDSGNSYNYVVEDKGRDSERLMKGFVRLTEELEPFEKMVVELSLVGGVNIRDMSKMLGISKGTIVKTRVVAIKKLREKLRLRKESFKAMTGRDATLREIIESAG